MNYLFAPCESRAVDFLKNNRFGLDDRTIVVLDSYSVEGRRYFDQDRIYVLDGVSPRTLATVQYSVALSGTKPTLISVEER